MESQKTDSDFTKLSMVKSTVFAVKEGAKE
jgi:hypothetical protein